jgi:hypothetical protein
MPASTYPGSSPAISVQALLKQPNRISRDLAALTFQRLVAWKILVHGSSDSVRGGAMQYQQAENIFVDTGQDVEEIAPRGDWPRALWTEALKTAAVKQFGLELPVDNLAIRRNQIDRIVRGERKLANNLVRFVDTYVLGILTDVAQGINSQASAAIEDPDASEGWASYDAGLDTPPIYVQVYEEKRPKGKVVSAGTWPAVAFTDPGAVVLITGV